MFADAHAVQPLDLDKPVEKMTVKEKELANICFKCGGPLHNRIDQHFHETKYPVRSVCCACVGHSTTVSHRISTLKTVRNKTTGKRVIIYQCTCGEVLRGNTAARNHKEMVA